jgi:hypothetical protein
MKTLLTPLAAVSLAACATVAAPNAPRIATVRVGEAARLGPLGIRVDRVVEDSRCPAQVQCVWQGRLVVALFAEDPVAMARQGGPNAPSLAVAQETMLTLGEPAKVILGHPIRLIAARPDPVAGQMTRSDAYLLTLKLD